MQAKSWYFPAPPNYWRYESGGELVPAMLRYLHSERLTQQDIALIRAYLRQWIGSPAWDRNPHANAESKAMLSRLRDSIEDLVSVGSINQWIAAATAEGFDPL